MDVVSAEVATELKGLVDGEVGEVLVTEGYIIEPLSVEG